MSKQQTAGQRPMRLTTSCPSIVFADVRAGCCRPAFVTLETSLMAQHDPDTKVDQQKRRADRTDRRRQLILSCP